MLSVKIQAVYFMFMGLWPLLHYGSFEAVTGKKVDTWLVRTIAGMFILIGAQLWIGKPEEIWLLGIGSALIIGIADIYFSLIKNRISWIYTVDAAPMAAFITLWLIFLF